MNHKTLLFDLYLFPKYNDWIGYTISFRVLTLTCMLQYCFNHSSDTAHIQVSSLLFLNVTIIVCEDNVKHNEKIVYYITCHSKVA